MNWDLSDGRPLITRDIFLFRQLAHRLSEKSICGETVLKAEINFMLSSLTCTGGMPFRNTINKDDDYHSTAFELLVLLCL